jgi:hypothetical protein
VELFNDPVKQKNLETILENQRKFLGESAREIVIPPSKRIGDRDVCKFCSNYVPIGSNLKKFGCYVWNYRPYVEDFSCEFYDPQMISGLNQLMMDLVKEAYPKSSSLHDMYFIKPIGEVLSVEPLGDLHDR